MDPLRPDAPFLGFFYGPKQVHSNNFKQQVEANSENSHEDGDDEVFAHAGVVNPLLLGNYSSDNNPYKVTENVGYFIKLS